MVAFTQHVRPAAVAGAFYPGDPGELRQLLAQQLAYARQLLDQHGDELRLPAGIPKAVIVPHAGYVYSGTTAALAYALLERGRGSVRRAIIVGPTHRVPVRGIAMCTAGSFATPLGAVPVDQDAESNALEGGAAPALIVNDPTHAQEHAVEVQIPWLQTVLGPDLQVVPLNAGDAYPEEVGDVLRTLWGGQETVIIISSDLSHYHPEPVGRRLDDGTIAAIARLEGPVEPDRACGAFPINGLLDVCLHGVARGTGAAAAANSDDRASKPTQADLASLQLRFLGCSTSGDGGEVALADPADIAAGGTGAPAKRPPVPDPRERVVGYASFALWELQGDDQLPGATRTNLADRTGRNAVTADAGRSPAPDVGSDAPASVDPAHASHEDHAAVLLALARAALCERLRVVSGEGGVPSVRHILAGHEWLHESGASFVTLTEAGQLRGCIGSLRAYRSLGEDVAGHAVDAALRDPRFVPVTADEYPLLQVEVSVLSNPEPIPVDSRPELERTLRPGIDGLILDDGRGHSATFLPQVWNGLPDPNDFVTHLLAKAGLPADHSWWEPSMLCSRYTVEAYADGEVNR